MSDKPQKTAWPAWSFLVAGFVTLAILVGGLGSWAVLTRIAGAVVAPGQIVVERNRVVLQHPDGGRVERILVDEGDLVAEGDLLIELDAARLTTDLTITEGQLFETMARRARAMAESTGAEDITFPQILTEAGSDHPEVAGLMAGQSRVMTIRRESEAQAREQIEKQQSQIGNQIEGIRAQRAGLARQLELISQELVSQKQLLEEGLTQATRVLSLEREVARLEGQVGELVASEAAAGGRVTELEIAILKLGTERRQQASEEERDLEYRENELTEKRAALLEQITRLEIRAPLAGVVYNFTPRTVIAPAEEVLSLVPVERGLEIDARIDPVHIDEVMPGQQVLLRFASFDQGDTPEMFGTVQKLSADAFMDQMTGGMFYRATVTLDPGEVEKLPKGAVLLPGMPVQAFLRTQERSPLAYLTKPLTDYFAKAFRD